MINDLRLVIGGLLDQLAFLELTSDEVLDPDVAVRKMEDIAATLNDLSLAAKAVAVDECARRAGLAFRDDERRFWQDVPQDIGLVEKLQVTALRA